MPSARHRLLCSLRLAKSLVSELVSTLILQFASLGSNCDPRSGIAAAVLVTDFKDEDQVKSNIVPLVQGIVDAVGEAASTINGLAEASGDGSARYLVKRQNAAVVAAACECQVSAS